MLKLHFKDNRQPAFWVTEKLYSIGSAADNQLVIKGDTSVNALHAKLIVEGNKFLLKDNNSTTGCFINGQRITNREILPGDIVKLGNTELIVLDPRQLHDNGPRSETAPWRLVSDSSWLPGKTFLVPVGRVVTIGRAEQCDITIPGTHLSRKHAELTVQDSRLMIKDLGSSNGTYLNEKRISEASADNDDRLRLDVYSFRVVAPETDAYRTRIRPIGDAINKPVERKAISSEPKQWITRPTSPGNRIEPVYNQPHAKRLALVVLALVFAAAIAAYFLW
jgi:pSer/pThr/pTyr-binding forkhead associated (FHA) protein